LKKLKKWGAKAKKLPESILLRAEKDEKQSPK
jgi:hypothetical protein